MSESKESRYSDERQLKAWGEFREACSNPNGKYGSIHDCFFHKFMTDPYMAIAFMKSYFPEWDETFELDGLEILPNEFYDKTLQKRVADLVYELPARNAAGRPLRIAVVIEHKAQSSFVENRKAAANMTSYVVSQSVAPLRNPKLEASPWATPQALAIMVYTGPDENYEAPKWEDFFPTPKGFEEYSIRFSIPCVNITRLYTRGQLVGPHVLRGVLGAMGRAGKRTIREERRTILAPFNEDDAPKDEKTEYYYKMTASYALYASGNINEPLTRDEFAEMISNDRRGLEVKNFLDEMLDRRWFEGKAEGKVEGKEEGAVLDFLEFLPFVLPGVSEEARRQIRNIGDASKLGALRQFLFQSKTAKEFEQGLASYLN